MNIRIKSVIALGIGNSLMSDEGIGVRVVEELAKIQDRFAEVEFCIIGTLAARIVHQLTGRRKAVLVDCAFMGEAPGTVRKFVPSEVKSLKEMFRHSLHEGDILEAIELSCSLGICSGEVVIFGIEPEKVAPGMELSDSLVARMPEYLEAVSAELRRV